MYGRPNASVTCAQYVYAYIPFNCRHCSRQQLRLQILSRFPGGGENLNPGFGDTVIKVRMEPGWKKKRWSGGTTDSRVSSNWALRLPSIVVAVQLSGQWISSQLVPRLSICQT